MEKEGSKRIEIVGSDDKRQLTAVFGASLAGDFLPPQLVYKGKTSPCLPVGVKFPSDWDLTYRIAGYFHVDLISNGWCGSKIRFRKILFAYLKCFVTWLCDEN